MEKLIKIVPHGYSLKEMLPIFERVWFVGKLAKETIMSLSDDLLGSPSEELLISNKIPEHIYTGNPFVSLVDWQAVSSIALHPSFQLELKKKNVLAVIICHAPVMINGERHLFGLDLNPTGPAGIFGRIDFWNIDACLRWNFFPKPKAGEFLFVTSVS